MAKHLRYYGEFASITGETWRCELLQEADEAYTSIGILTFDADEPLVLEWEETSKDQAICGSAATMKVISPGDRTYEDLYTIEAGNIRLDVYRDGALYWSGCIDTEFYEEPYERYSGYTVTLTFSDFGYWERLSYDLTGLQTLSAVLDDALDRAGLSYSSLDYTTYASTYFADGVQATLDALSIRSDNFYDEDGEASTLEEVIEGVLQPLGLRIVQRAGTVYVYDLNGLYNSGTQTELTWSGDSQTMGADSVYNNVKVTFSPYGESSLLSGELEFGGEYDTDHTNLSSTSPTDLDDTEYYSYYPDYGDDSRVGTTWDYNLVDFTIFTSTEGSGLADLSSSARYFHILPMVGSAEESDGVAWMFYTGGHGSLKSGYPVQKLNTFSASHSLLMTTNQVYLPTLDEDTQSSYLLRYQQQVLIDPRYNPFNDADDGNEESNYNRYLNYAHWLFLPVAITIRDDDGNALYHFYNRDIVNTCANGHIGYAKGQWVAGEASLGDAYLEYYGNDDSPYLSATEAGILGWATNRQCIGRPDATARRAASTHMPSSDVFQYFTSFQEMDDGEFIPYPPVGGWLEISVYSGARVFAWDVDSSTDLDDASTYWEDKGWYDLCRWQLYKAPVVDVVKNNLVFDDANLDDVEYSGYLNKSAKESLEIDTICGTADEVCPTARGVYFRTSTAEQVTQFTREGVTDNVEKLFIGTMYSQYAERKTTLTGEASMDAGGLYAYTEQNQSGKLFLMTSDRQDVRMGCSEVTIVEFMRDEYEGIEEVE